MFRKRFIIKVDDVATWSLDDFQRFARFVETNDAKADKQDLVLTKTADQSYLLDARALRYEHRLTLRLPQDTRSSSRTYCSGG